MSATGSLRDRSLLRRAFEAAAQGAVLGIAAEVYATLTPESAAKKASHMLGAGERDDLNPSWALLDAIFLHDPATIFHALCAAAGFAMPERLPEPEATSLARIEQHLEQLELGLADVREALRERKGPIRKVPPRERGRGAA